MARIGGSVSIAPPGAGTQVRRQPSDVRLTREVADRGRSFRDAKGQLVKAHVFARSTFSIFQYLGRIVAAGEAGKIKLMTPQAIGHAPLKDDTLFAVNTGGGGDCFCRSTMGRPIASRTR